MFAHRSGPETGDQGQAARLVLGVQLLHQNLEVIRRGRRAAFEADGVHHTPAEFDMRAIRLTRTVADPDHVARTRDPFARGGIDAGQRLFVFQQKCFVRGVEIHGAQLMGGLGGHACGGHEIQRVLNAVGDVAVFLSLIPVGKPEGPGMDVMHVGETTGREGAQARFSVAAAWV